MAERELAWAGAGTVGTAQGASWHLIGTQLYWFLVAQAAGVLVNSALSRQDIRVEQHCSLALANSGLAPGVGRDGACGALQPQATVGVQLAEAPVSSGR
jgi:hypothetical protein